MEISDWISLGGVLGALIMSGWALVYTRSSAKSESALRELMPLSSLRLDEFCGSAIHRSAYGRG
ncbi:hypothetical protein, partial [Nonomuraea sp. NPDC049028]|uniref:hypothetical protein n=1 Tax=Nonomuraea sp. NPDC049028 TaxID=3364348 RepID=UPI0037184044